MGYKYTLSATPANEKLPAFKKTISIHKDHIHELQNIMLDIESVLKAPIPEESSESDHTLCSDTDSSCSGSDSDY